jgi:4-hydroxyproline epimerase
MSEGVKIIKVIDSHTAGEPTRVVVSGAPDNPGATPTEWREFLRNEHDWLRTAMACEPRGHEAVVGALLCEPTQPDCVAGVVFFNNVGYLHGCLHGTIGVTVTLAHLGRLNEGDNKIETPTGIVTVREPEDGWVSVRNVRSWCHAAAVSVEVPDWGTVQGDVAWGGNWFFLIEAGDAIKVDFSNLDQLTDFTCAVRRALEANSITGEDGGEIDHIEVFGPPANEEADSKNFVLCPGLAYDRSPCGTGTSAKLACLHAADKLQPGQVWRQAGILDTIFEGTVEEAPKGGVFPTVRGRAFVTAEAQMIVHPDDPFAHGIVHSK